ncbi:hypothetical protein [Paracidobacterium acidisoli]|uniref:Twin-arginine translocation signal domain-containing protein n=1 Tax=Paracidobacterium acidisoli TaxID=2303751 RepID=A0A372IM31_9BACT|nr:hypothetical protein [Paracidobacterium acidisoli]MBT9332415.1 hypothetical protein [Paracidobacterium acidisoli]
MDRREFMQGAGAAALGLMPAARAVAAATTPDPMVGIQVGAVSFVDEGVEKCLDIFQQDGAVNTLFVATFTYGRGIAGRQVPGQPLPDHGKQQYDTATFHGGCFTDLNPKYFANSPLKVSDFRAPDFGNYDVLKEVIPAAKKRGMKTICWFEDVFRRDIPNIDQFQEKELSGANAQTLCFNNPNYHNWLLGMVENWGHSYDVDGIMWGSERQGAFANVIEATHDEASSPLRATCFCQYCRAKAKERGIDPERAHKGFMELVKYVDASRKGQRPTDGHFVTLWRFMLYYPELLAWEMLWTQSLRDTYAAIYAKVKEVRPSLQIGWHIWHNNSFNPIYRAEQDLQAIAPHSDFLKIVMYNNCGGERMAEYIDNVHSTIYGDVPEEELLQFHYRVLNYQEKGLAEIPLTGLSSDYVYREAKRAHEGLKGTNTRLWPGIDIDIPTAKGHSTCTPQGVHDAVLAALHGGADGVLLSRKYSEMKLADLKGAGDAIRQFRKA